MIKVQHLNKSFGDFQVLNDLNLHVKKGSIYGLIGENGSGKTTLIKHIIGVWQPDSGSITMDGVSVIDNTDVKDRLGYIPDDLSFFASYTLKDCAHFFQSIYSRWDQQRYAEMLTQLQLEETRKMSKFSKGMQKQAAFALVMSCLPDILVLDEPIDGLDPLVRKLVWKSIIQDVAERDMAVLISSHNLREMEDICDSIGILKKGTMVIERELDELKSDIHKVQVAYKNAPETPYAGLNVLHKETRGSVDLLIIRNRREVVEEIIGDSHPAVFDILPLSLEEIFIYELGGEHDELENILF